MQEPLTMELRTYDKACIKLTQAQADAVLRSITKGDKFIILKGAYVLVSNVSGIYPLSMVESKATGRLHDGTRVVKMYGRWVDAENPDVHLSHSHYPELANDSVMSEHEYEEAREGERSIGGGDGGKGGEALERGDL